MIITLIIVVYSILILEAYFTEPIDDDFNTE